MTREIVPTPQGSLRNLAFDKNGDFVIAHLKFMPLSRINLLQFTGCSDLNSTYFMERVLDQLKPDLIIFNGDVMSHTTPKGSGSTYTLLRTRASLIRISKVARDRHIPWAITLGNHDDEGDATREEIMRLVQQLPYSVSFRGNPALPGYGNYHLNILKHVTSKDVGHRLWFLDSGAYSYLAENGTAGPYGMVEPQTVEWFSKRAAEFNADSNVSSSAFFHIPLAEVSDAILNTTAQLEPAIGVHGEDICSQGNGCDNLATPKNALFRAFVEAKNIKSVWSGHDHSNDFIQFRDGIALGYDGSAGYGSYSSGDPNYNREMRVIALKDFGAHASSYKILDDIVVGTVHRNTSEPIVTLF